MDFNEKNRHLSVPKPEHSRQMDSEFTDTSKFSSQKNIPESELEEIYKQEVTRASRKARIEEAEQYGFSKKTAVANSKKGGDIKKKHLKLRIIIGTIAALLGVVVGIVCFFFWYKDYLLSRITYNTTASNAVITIVNEHGETVALSDVTETTQYEVIQSEPIKNFLLIGIDSRSKNYNESGTGERADVIVVMSIDSNQGTIKLLSIARDSYAFFPGYSTPHKINAAMSYGGPDLLQATVEGSLRIKIDGYAYVNFSHMAQIIDAVGGVYVNMTSSEAYYANQHITAIYGNSAAFINSTGEGTWVNGIQAVAYARVRYTGNGDYERMERQIEVLRSLMTQYMKLSAIDKMAVMDDVFAAIVTNIPKEDIEKYALDFLPSLSNAEMQYLQLPIEGCFNAGIYGDEWSMRVNWNALIPYVQLYFYGETTDFDEVWIPNHAPSLDSCDTDIPLENLVH
ncbi:MAG: LCP family protein [Saccharofermentans sp.]|nr:LCP family protein [Saccharofermentans sp.]